MPQQQLLLAQWTLYHRCPGAGRSWRGWLSNSSDFSFGFSPCPRASVHKAVCVSDGRPPTSQEEDRMPPCQPPAVAVLKEARKDSSSTVSSFFYPGLLNVEDIF
ncbi:hypothetical protein LIER_32199 [Lithospermum erythrorhizon]|uniref:Uncharacterized protein n=1 Tax=Lithospermum erythrorhizon TaxID=34254 RepID=A0AAV3RT73_LITER